jgi:hypothetical protein
MNSLDDSLDYTLAKSTKGYNEASADHMHQKAHHRLLQFLLARFLLLSLFIEEACKCKGGLRPANHRRLWVLMQARPTQILGRDAFMEVAQALRKASTDDLRKQIRDGYYKLQPTLGSRPLHLFLNEMGQFWGDDKDTERPLLRPIWLTMTQIFDSSEMQVILSGTAIDVNLLEEVLGSTALKLFPYDFKKDIGAFDDLDAQRQYIEHYLPGNQSEAWEAFLERAWGWCRGRYFLESSCRPDAYHFVVRYRGTASLITLILMTGRCSPHKVLDAYVECSTNFKPTDGVDWSANEPELYGFNQGIVSRWNFDRMSA